MYQSPNNFMLEIKNDKFTLTYSDVMEIAQGGPEIGRISINSKSLGERYFGGPILSNDNYIFIPEYLEKGIGYGFKIARISINDLKTDYFGPFKDVIFLDKIDGNKIVFYEDVYKKKKNIVELNGDKQV